MQNKKKVMLYFANITQQIFNIFFIGRFIQENKSTKNFLTKTIYSTCHKQIEQNRYTRFLAEY